MLTILVQDNDLREKEVDVNICCNVAVTPLV